MRFLRNHFLGLIFLSLILIFGCSKNESNNSENKSTEQKTEVSSGNREQVNQTNATGESIEVKLPTMQCGTCKKNIETAVKKLDGINSVNVVVKDKVAKVNFDKNKTDLTKIEGAIVMAGYQANEKPGDKKAYDNLEACCKVGGGH